MTEVSRAAPEYYSDQDDVGRYLQEIQRYPLLNAEQEVELAKRIEAGLYASELLEQENYELGGEEELAWLKQDGEVAAQTFYESNLRLVVNIAKKYGRNHLSLLDRIQEGNTGLDRAVKKFDYTKGFKFSTYATWWIRQSITRGVMDTGRTIRLPVHMGEKINKMEAMRRKLMIEEGLEPSIERLAEALDITREEVLDLKHYKNLTTSLDAPLGDDGEATFGDLLVEDTLGVDELVADRLLNEDVQVLIDHLDTRKAEIIRMRFGFYGKEYTLDEVGKVFGVTRERIRQLEKQALGDLKKLSDPDRFHD